VVKNRGLEEGEGEKEMRGNSNSGEERSVLRKVGLVAARAQAFRKKSGQVAILEKKEGGYPPKRGKSRPRAAPPIKGAILPLQKGESHGEVTPSRRGKRSAHRNSPALLGDGGGHDEGKSVRPEKGSRGGVIVERKRLRA